ncbi:hypothetical protein ACFOFO_25845, partial [Undibacterium arcticum]
SVQFGVECVSSLRRIRRPVWLDYALEERFAKFGLKFHPEKTRLIEFGRWAAVRRQRRGLGRPETFDLLGFTHCCGTTRTGRFKIVRLTIMKRMRATLQAIRDKLKRRRHEPVKVTGAVAGSGNSRVFQLPRRA